MENIMTPEEISQLVTNEFREKQDTINYVIVCIKEGIENLRKANEKEQLYDNDKIIVEVIIKESLKDFLVNRYKDVGEEVYSICMNDYIKHMIIDMTIKEYLQKYSVI